MRLSPCEFGGSFVEPFWVYSDANDADCTELRFMAPQSREMLRAFKTPSLRGVAGRPPYMHAGQIDTLEDVIAHYVAAPEAPAGHSELHPLELNEHERRQIAAFLRSLEGSRHDQLVVE